jgi:serine/threonine protein kinase
MPELVQGSTALISLEANRAGKSYKGAANIDFFTRECEVYARLGKHPHIATLLEIQHQTIFLEKGQCLRGILQQNNTTDEQKTSWILELARGLEYIHSKNIVHADLNAANIIICRSAQEEDHAK